LANLDLSLNFFGDSGGAWLASLIAEGDPKRALIAEGDPKRALLASHVAEGKGPIEKEPTNSNKQYIIYR